MEKLDTNSLAVEIRGIAMVLCGLANHCSTECDHLTDEAMNEALYGLGIILQRIADDVRELD